jgi:antitoxin ParD1/3/4
MPTRNVVLTDRHEAFIKTLVAEGRYQNASEVLRDGLRLIEAREAVYAEKLAALRAAVQVGLDAVEAGDYIDFESFDDLDAYLEKLTDDVLAGETTKAKD